VTAVHAVPAVPAVASWREPRGIAPRGTVIVVPGRGEHPRVYERFGRRIAADGYRVEAVSAPTVDEARTEGQIRALLESPPSVAEGETGPDPRVLVGSDTGALFAAGLVAAGLPGVAGLVLAGLPTRRPGHVLSWEDELEARTACPAHQGRLAEDPALRRGAFAAPVPDSWFSRARPDAIRVPVLGVHGEADAISPLDDARGWFAEVPAAELVGVSGGRHDAFNDQTHRTAAATVVLFLERLRLGADLPVLARPQVLR
jgi:alpha-beta hydrolase superfamily lysophospholipase